MEGYQKDEREQRQGTQKQQWEKVGVYPKYQGQSKYEKKKKNKWGCGQNVTSALLSSCTGVASRTNIEEPVYRGLHVIMLVLL